ncbi:MAG: maltose ABC transporter substrate-binding protein [Candidatus Promineifilaceae bacterium]|nr:maltose ABC transporter substrate-binding protein [Candidatus Promineifilaceae bacterium]
MHKKKWYLLILLLLVGAMVFTACDTDDTTVDEVEVEDIAEDDIDDETGEVIDEGEDEDIVEEDVDVVEEEDVDVVEEDVVEEDVVEEDVVVEDALVVWADDTRAPILAALATEFEAEFGVALVVEQVADIREQFAIAAPAGEGPDIVIGAHDWIGELVAGGLLAEMDLGAKQDDFLPVSLEAFTIGGNLYGMPYAIENIALFYNADLVETPPETWEELRDISQELVDAGEVEYGMAVPVGATYDAYPLYTAFGGFIFPQENGDFVPTNVGLDEPGFIEAGNFLQDMIDAGLAPSDADWDTAHILFEQGDAAFIMAGPWALDRISASGVPFGIAGFPDATEPGQPFLGVQGFMVNALSDQVFLAQAFLTEFVATEDVMTELQEAGLRPSAYIPVFEDIEDENLLTFGEIGADAALMPAIPEMAAVWGAWGDAITLIMQGEQEPEDALTTAGEQVEEALGIPE